MTYNVLSGTLSLYTIITTTTTVMYDSDTYLSGLTLMLCLCSYWRVPEFKSQVCCDCPC